MTHLEFWLSYCKSPPSNGWVVFENGTLVHPLKGDTAENVLIRLEKALGGYSGAGGCLGDFYVCHVRENHYIISFDSDAGLLMTHVESDAVAVVAGIIGRENRNKDARERVRV